MKDKNYLFKMMLYISTALCVATAVAVLAGAQKSLALTIAGTVTAAQLYLAFAYENVKLKMAALTAVMCVYTVASKPNTGITATYWLFWSTLALTAVYNIGQIRLMYEVKSTNDENPQTETKAVNLDSLFALSVAVLVVMFAVIFLDAWRGAYRGWTHRYMVFIVMIIVQSAFLIACAKQKRKILKPVVTSALTAVAVSAACLVFYLLVGSKIIRFNGKIYVNNLPILFSSMIMVKILALKKAMSAEDTYK